MNMDVGRKRRENRIEWNRKMLERKNEEEKTGKEGELRNLFLN